MGTNDIQPKIGDRVTLLPGNGKLNNKYIKLLFGKVFAIDCLVKNQNFLKNGYGIAQIREINPYEYPERQEYAQWVARLYDRYISKLPEEEAPNEEHTS